MTQWKGELVWKVEVRPWESTPIAEDVFGDSGPWIWEVPTLWRLLADPDRSRVTASRPVASGTADNDSLGEQITYWSPLLTLTYRVLGWARPDVGVQRWEAAGRPTDEPALALLDRWWVRPLSPLGTGLRVPHG